MIYLYVKQHSITKLKYFGKTIKKDPYSYKGSGVHWQHHIKKHGRSYVETLELWEFVDQEEATKFALKFSEENDIVESLEWANKIPEDAKEGGSRPCSEETKLKMSQAQKNRRNREALLNPKPIKIKMPKILSEEHKNKIRLGNLGKINSEETKLKMSQAKLGKKFSNQHKENLKRNHAGMLNKTHSEETRLKMSQAQRENVTCPKCNKSGNKASMMRWHFDNCRN